MNNDLALLEDYALRGQEAAFETLVTRYVDLVYSAAWRQLHDRSLAEEVTQSAFILLARKARQLGPGTVLPSWLYRAACHVARDVLKQRRRRERREQEAQSLMNPSEAEPWQQIAPLLDAAMAGLAEKDRDAVVLRFFENKSLREVGEALGASEEAAKMRVNRAVEKLRNFFARRGAIVPAAALAAAISAHSVQAAPNYLAVSVVAAVKGSAAGGATLTLFKLIAMTKLKFAVIGAAALAAATTPLVLQQKALARLRDENQALQQQVEQQSQLAAENERLSGLITETVRTNGQTVPADQLNELLRLRGEVGRLRATAKELAQLKDIQARNPVNDLRQKLRQMPDKAIPELKALEEGKWAEDAGKGKLDTEEGVREVMGKLRRAAKIRFASDLGQALNGYLKASNGQMPNDLAELKPYFRGPVDDSSLQRYSLLRTGTVSDLGSPEPLIAEKAAVDDWYDTLFKISADGYTMEGVGRWNGQTMTNKWTF